MDNEQKRIIRQCLRRFYIGSGGLILSLVLFFLTPYWVFLFLLAAPLVLSALPILLTALEALSSVGGSDE